MTASQTGALPFPIATTRAAGNARPGPETGIGWGRGEQKTEGSSHFWAVLGRPTNQQVPSQQRLCVQIHMQGVTEGG